MGLRKRIKNSNRGGPPTSVSPYPKKLPPGPIPYSFTFDFTSPPDPINNGQPEGDDWLYEIFDGTGYYGSPDSSSSYNQTVGGRSGVAKWEHVDPFEWTYTVFYGSAPFAFPGSAFANKFGRISSWPSNYLDYSTCRLRFDVYFSGLRDPSTPLKNIQYGITGLTTIENNKVVAEEEWLTFDTGEKDISGANAPFFFIRIFAEVAPLWANDGFIALDNVTLTMTP